MLDLDSVVLAIAMFVPEDKYGRSVNFYTFKNCEPLGTEGQENGYGHYPATIELSPSMVINEPEAYFTHCHILAGYANAGCHIFCVGGKNSRCWECYREGQSDPWDGLRTFEVLSCRRVETLRSMSLYRVKPKLVVVNHCVFAIGGGLSQVASAGIAGLLPEGPLKCNLLNSPRPEVNTFVEYYSFGKMRWIKVDNPPDDLGFDMNHYVCGVIGQLIIFGSPSHEDFIALQLSPPHGNDMKWTRTGVKFDAHKLGSCYGSPPALSHEGHLLWLDYRKGTQLIVLDWDAGSYLQFNLGEQGLLPSPNCRHYCTKLVLCDRGGGFPLGIVWKDKNIYNLGETKELAGYHLTTFAIRDGTLVTGSHFRCFLPGGYSTLVHAFPVH